MKYTEKHLKVVSQFRRLGNGVIYSTYSETRSTHSEELKTCLPVLLFIAEVRSVGIEFIFQKPLPSSINRITKLWITTEISHWLGYCQATSCVSRLLSVKIHLNNKYCCLVVLSTFVKFALAYVITDLKILHQKLCCQCRMSVFAFLFSLYPASIVKYNCT